MGTWARLEAEVMVRTAQIQGIFWRWSYKNLPMELIYGSEEKAGIKVLGF